jgi:hypothetical protein
MKNGWNTPDSMMTRRRFLGTAGACAAMTLDRSGMNTVRRKGMLKPNFLILVADDMSYADSGCYGGGFWRQPPKLIVTGLAKRLKSR